MTLSGVGVNPGRYLRHFGHELRVERSDRTDLFRQDGSFEPVTGRA